MFFRDVEELWVSQICVIHNNATRGGGIYLNGVTCKMFCNNNVSSNVAVYGGGIYMSENKEFPIYATVISLNEAMVDGGGVYVHQNNKLFSIFNGVISSNVAASHGGGMYSYTSNNQMRLVRSIVEDNEAGSDGGGIYLLFEHKSILLLNVQWNFNRAGGFGGGLYLGASCIFITSNVSISYNLAGIDGGGMYVARGNGLWLENMQWLGNVAVESGGALAVASYVQELHVWNCTFDSNHVGSCGSAIHLVGSNRHANLQDNVFVNNSAAVYGGGVYVGQSSHDLRISRCAFLYNLGNAGGGGVGVTFATRNVMIQDSIFIGNEGGRGAGVMMDKLISSSTLRNLTFRNNKATFYGGGGSIGTVSRDIHVTECVFENNTAAVYGGGFHVNEENYDVMISSSLFVANSARYGGAMTFLQGNQHMDVFNVTMRQNSATLSGGGVFFLWLNEHVSFSHTILAENSGVLGGGAIYVSPLNFFINISDCFLYANNGLSGNGGAICSFADSVLLLNSRIERNTATVAGGAYMESLDVKLHHVYVIDNIATSSGGVHLSKCSAVSMQDVNFAQNVAKSGMGGALTLHASFDVNMSSCTIHSNIAMGSGGVHITDVSGMFMTNSSIVNNIATSGVGGGKAVLSSSDLMFGDLYFYNNVASMSGGAMAIQQSSYVTIVSSEFDVNNALTGSGGAIYVTESKPTSLNNNVFRNCSAFAGGGGAVWWRYDNVMWKAPGGLSASGFYNNSALYGNDIATNAMQIEVPTNSFLHVESYATPLADVQVQLLDFYSNTDQLASGNVVEATALSSDQCGNRNGQVHGGTMVESLNGSAAFRQLFASCYPGGVMTVQFKTPLDYKTVYAAHNITFRQCRRGEYYADGACLLCPEGKYSIRENRNNAIRTCDSCPSAAKHCIGSIITLHDKYWRLSNMTSTIHACPYPKGCKGGYAANEASCEVGYEGPLCAVCSNGFYFETSTSSCEKCPSGGLNVFGIIIVAIVGCLLSIPVFVLTLRFAHSSSADTLITNLSCSALFFMVYVRCIALRRSITEKERIQKEDAWNDFFVRLQPKLKIYVSLVQILSALPFVLNVTFPSLFASLLNIGSLLNINFAAALGVTCYGSFDYIDYLVMTTIIPVLLSTTLLIICISHVVYVQYRRTNSEATITTIIGKYLTIFLIGTFLVLPGVSVYIFRVFSCHDIDPNDDVPGDDIYMRADYSISCVSSRYYFGRIYAVCMILVYPVGVPFLYFILLYSRRHFIQTRDSKALSELCLAKMKPLSFLYSSYEPRYWYWEIVETFRRILLTGVLVLVAQGSALQIVVGLLIAMVYIKLYSYFGRYMVVDDLLMCLAPFSDPLLDTDMEFVQYQLFAVLFVTLLMSQSENNISLF